MRLTLICFCLLNISQWTLRLCKKGKSVTKRMFLGLTWTKMEAQLSDLDCGTVIIFLCALGSSCSDSAVEDFMLKWMQHFFWPLSEDGETRQGTRRRAHWPHPTPSLVCRADICKLKGWRCLKALITPLLGAQCTLHHWKLVLLMLSRVKYSGVVQNALCCWFRVGWSRNNGHEKNMARLWEATHFHYFRRHGAQNGARGSGCRDSFTHVKHVVTSVLPETWTSPCYPSQRKTGPSCTVVRLGVIRSSCALRDTYKPIMAKCAVFERVGEVKSRVSLMPNCSH